jgi:hypothetical protein
MRENFIGEGIRKINALDRGTELIRDRTPRVGWRSNVTLVLRCMCQVASSGSIFDEVQRRVHAVISITLLRSSVSPIRTSCLPLYTQDTSQWPPKSRAYAENVSRQPVKITKIFISDEGRTYGPTINTDSAQFNLSNHLDSEEVIVYFF